MAYAMARSRAREDRAMAVEMAYFVGAMPVQRDRPVEGREQDARREQLDRQVPDTVDRSEDARPDLER
jgi:hypothetical protein